MPFGMDASISVPDLDQLCNPVTFGEPEVVLLRNPRRSRNHLIRLYVISEQVAIFGSIRMFGLGGCDLLIVFPRVRERKRG